jgi:hypothetical protein
MSDPSTRELMKRWEAALADVLLFREICTPDCQVWHSADNKWMTAEAAIEAARDRGGLPPFKNVRITVTEHGFLAQASTTVDPVGTIHVLQLVTVKDGKAARVEEYIGPEMNIAV